MKIKSEGFDNFFVVVDKKQELLLKNLDVVINECTDAGCITELWAIDIILAFEASGYRIVKATAMQESEIKWIYESPDGGKTIYRRPFGEHDTPREKIDRSQIPRIYDKTRESILR